MRQETIVKTYLTYDELTEEQKEEAIELNFAQDFWHFEHNLQERIDTLKAFAKYVGGTLDYSISCVPDRGEFIKVRDINLDALKKFLRDESDCFLTGVCYDEDLKDAIKKNSTMSDAFSEYLSAIHKEYEYTLSHEYISELCEANEYEFDASTLKLS